MLAAIEEDFRTIIGEFCSESDPSELLPAALLDTVRQRRQRDGVTATITRVGQAVAYLDFQDAFDLVMRSRVSLPSELFDAIRDIQKRLQALVPVRNRVAHNRPLEVNDLPAVAEMVETLVGVPGFNWPETLDVQKEVRTDPGYIYRASLNLVIDPSSAVANNLPAPDFDETTLLGRKEELRKIARALRGSWPVISILGDGGIGKTALALQACYDLADQKDCPFEAIIWVTAKNAQLTSTEIVRIETVVHDSLGLFAAAAAAVGSRGSEDAVGELLEILSSFPTLLVLDNVETVLDDHFPDLLRDIPMRSKVLITSRVGVKTENPFKLTGLSIDDAKILLRSLARARNLELSAFAVDDNEIGSWVTKMQTHPAYLKWFVSGLQVGKTPEELLTDNGLVLDFCMSNVFDFLGEDAKKVLEAMVIVPGSHTMAELAFLTDFDAPRIRAAVADLTRTNFAQNVSGGSSGTTLQLSDFAREYLRKSVTIAPDLRTLVVQKKRELYFEGGGLQVAHEREPYSHDTVDTRGVGYYSAARLLRQALDLSQVGDFDAGIRLCAEAAELAPGYHEAARVEGRLHELSLNFGEAHDAYAKARDLAPENPFVAHFFGEFLVNSGFDPVFGLAELRRAATKDPDSSFLQVKISQTHLTLGSPRLAMEAAAYAINASSRSGAIQDRWLSSYWLFRACAVEVRSFEHLRDWAGVAESIEFAVETTSGLHSVEWSPDTLDLLMLLGENATKGQRESVDDFVAKKLGEMGQAITRIRTNADLGHLDRKVGRVQNLMLNRGFGFLACEDARYFFHASSMLDRRNFDNLNIGSPLAFLPGSQPASGRPAALNVAWLP